MLQYFPTAEGYVNNTPVNGASNYSYVFNYTDHLGNIRVSYKKNAQNVLEILEENNYYPFGLKHEGYNTDNKQPNYKYKYNGKELQDELGLNMYDYGWRNYMPDIGRWTQIDPLFNDLKFANDNSQVDDEDDQNEVYMSIINDLELGGGIYNIDNLNPYGYGYNNPVSFDDPDGRCPSCFWGAIIGIGVDYGLQVATNFATGKRGMEAWTNIDRTSIYVSAGAGALSGGISALKQYKNASTVVKIGVDIATDTGVSIASQGIKDGKVSLENTAIDVTAGQFVGRGVGKIVEKKALNSVKGKQLQANINREKNIARGKSNSTPKSKADVDTAKKRLNTYVNKRSSASSATASGAASTTVENLNEKKKKK